MLPAAIRDYGHSVKADHSSPWYPTAAPALACRPDPPPLQPRILVAEDEPALRRFNREVLIRSGYRVDAAEDGAIAWQTLNEIRNTGGYDLLITDNDMPKVSGIELLQKVHAAHLALPVIMTTGTPPWETFIQFPWLQPAVTLLKPYTRAEFLEAVTKVLCPTAAYPVPAAPPSQYREPKENHEPSSFRSDCPS
jgi:DNA-binding response OmpR family regulator